MAKIEVMKIICKNCNNSKVRVDTAEKCIAYDRDITRSRCPVRSCLNCIHRDIGSIEDKEVNSIMAVF